MRIWGLFDVENNGQRIFYTHGDDSKVTMIKQGPMRTQQIKQLRGAAGCGEWRSSVKLVSSTERKGELFIFAVSSQCDINNGFPRLKTDQ
ncbi:hypothetical protein PGIGA_G00247250 [Pangasianodon gigas]|uniref:Uncharacterized protein n=1 Tax=Pangasianodon gigas TaxID=30993 RepID=A0ACC5WPJ7_PANGG|nr:hypothetical protein [Pangasianodon gigas]